MNRAYKLAGRLALVLCAVGAAAVSVSLVAQIGMSSKMVQLKAPAGNLPATQHVSIDGYDAAVLPTGRIVTPVGIEVNVQAPKPYGMAVSADGKTAITINSGTRPFSLIVVKV